MGVNGVKYDIKTCFLIANTFNVLVGGLFPLSLGAGLMLSKHDIESMVCGLQVGLPIVGLAVIGFLAAVNENKKMLNIYSVVAGLLAAIEVLAVAAAELPSVFFVDDLAIVDFCIFHAGITLATTALAFYLAKQIPQDETQTAPIPTSFKCFGYGFLIVLIVLYFLNDYFKQ